MQKKTRILIVSDTHAASLDFSTLPIADLAIHCGDLTVTGKPHEHAAAIKLLETLPAPTKLVIPGNHDLTLDGEYCAVKAGQRELLYAWNELHNSQQLDEIRAMYTKARNAGIHYIVEGLSISRLQNGVQVRVFASAYTPEFCGWAFAYKREDDRFNHTSAPHRVPDYNTKQSTENMDIMITHGPPQGILDETSDGTSVGCIHLRRATCRCKPILHCFGHIHEAWGSSTAQWLENDSDAADFELQSRVTLRDADDGESYAYCDLTQIKREQQTQFINASIMNIRYQPVQKPWVVDMMLSCDSNSTGPFGKPEPQMCL